MSEATGCQSTKTIPGIGSQRSLAEEILLVSGSPGEKSEVLK